MDVYPPEYTTHEFPLVLLSGLADAPDAPLSSGPAIECNVPLVQSHSASFLLRDFLALQGNTSEWTARASKGPSGLIGFKFKLAGRKYNFPARKADPPSPHHVYKEDPTADDHVTTSSQWVLHSPLSPLSPASPLYPDGVFTTSWMAKHQDQIPCLFLVFFDFTSDPNKNSLNDNKLKADISNIRSALQKSEYKTRFAVVLLSDKTITEAPDIEERLATIRRATALDPKTGIFFLPPKLSRVEIASFVTTLLVSLQPICIDYYRDLTKHSRRKKNRGSLPPPTLPPTRTSSHPLSSHGWGIRYEIKLGVLAEFRQEMDTACRHYTSALEALMGPEGVFETTVSWSPRWDEGRQLSDMMAFRIIRCLLWTQMTTTATQSWINYRDRMHELVDRRGKGSSNYGWEAWESRWAKIMAELIQRADIPAMYVADSIDMTESMILAKSENSTFLPPEKAFAGLDRIPPWNYMHHSGYWMRLSARSAKRRLRYANAIPEEDRLAPDQSPASAVAKKSRSYDIYLCPDPHDEYSDANHKGFDHSADIIGRLETAAQAFTERKQTRFVERIKLETGREFLRKQDYEAGVHLLGDLYRNCTWRREKWWLPLFELARVLAECARQTGDLSVLVSTLFELHAPNLRLMRDMKIDLMNCGKTLGSSRTEDQKAVVELSPSSSTSFLNTAFIFVAGEGHVGESIQAQLKIFSEAHQNTAPVTFSRIRCQFKQNRYELEMSHSGDEAAARPPSAQSNTGLGSVDIVNLANKRSHETDHDGRIVFKSKANLVFHPGRRVVFIVAFDFKEPGEIELDYLIAEIETAEFHVIHTSQPTHFARPLEWLADSDDGSLVRKRMTREEPWSADIRPKPPKLDVKILDLERSMYTDEPIKIEFQITNGEDEEVSATLHVRLLTQGTPPEIAWIHSEESEPPSDSDGDGASSRSLDLPHMAVVQSLTRTAIFTAPSLAEEIILESKLHYFLPSDPEVPLSKTFTTNLSINSPFEANYDFSPHAHPDPWPSFFSVSSAIPGLVQRWSLTASVASFASETLILHKVAFEIDKKPSALECSIITGVENDGTEVHPRTMRHFNFIFDTTRSSAKEHRTMSMTTKLAISWSRIDQEGEGEATVITSTLPVSPLQLPPIEPRVVAMTKPMPPTKPDKAVANLTWLTLFMENPTGHPLTFDITVPSSDSVAFSGPKQQAVTILPYSRTEVDFRLLALVRDAWVVFGVKVMDRYFAREVEVLAGEGLKVNEEGGVKWWIE